MKKIGFIRKILSSAIAVVLLLSLFMQSGYVSIEKMACGSCEDKVSIGEVKSCCSAESKPSGNLCTIEQKCCKSEKSDYQIFRISQNLSQLSLDDLALFYFVGSSFGTLELVFQQFTSWNIHGPPSINKCGRQLLIAICKYSL